MNKELDKYAVRMDIRRFGEVMPKRQQHIAMGASELPKMDYRPNLLAKALHPAEQHLLVSEITEHPEGAKSFTLIPDETSDTKRLAYFRAGQYISLKLTIGDSTLTRPYTLSSSPAQALCGFYRITVKPSHSGFAGNWICENWRIGTKVDASAPLGEFYYTALRDSAHVVGVCGGSGVTPFVSMAHAIADGTESFNLTLLIGSRNRAETLFYDELNALAASCNKLHIQYVLSDEKVEGFAHGLIDKALISAAASNSGDYSLFACGPRAMYVYLEKQIEQLSLAQRRVRFEVSGVSDPSGEDGWDAAVAGKTFTLTLRMRDAEFIIPCPACETLLAAMERAGLTPPSHCRSGECGFCRSHLLSGEVFMPARCDARRLSDKEYGFIHPCCSFPLSDVTLSVASEQGDSRRPEVLGRGEE